MTHVRLLIYLLPALVINLLLVIFIQRIVSGESVVRDVASTNTQRLSLYFRNLPPSIPPSAHPAEQIQQPVKSPRQPQLSVKPPETRPISKTEVQVSKARQPEERSSRHVNPPRRTEKSKHAHPGSTHRPARSGESRRPNPALNGPPPESALPASVPVAPVPSYRPPPVYPRRAKKNGTEGVVTVAFTIAKDGTVHQPRIVKAIPPECLTKRC